ncbi:hypothetical protein SAMN02745206_02035 [Desulfacinum infernum DSM 9756]|uniref:Uncharacterized protein n=1 Tax=Desulfacinum infernum DSM 9756 TaxID=1121391 RepID=A0A1M5BVK2_9BACT|nr:hypothetical protein [Desulfacinum infernum]SHF46450.1 hypothetical protein SAMN02745206_02035 [Desulfacinum infernum DSM 9756]
METDRDAMELLRRQVAELEAERDRLRARVSHLEEALQGCLSRSRH